MADLIPSFLREQRHVFGVCPHCSHVARLTDIEVSYKTSYVKDWLDRIQNHIVTGEQRLEDFEKERDALHDRAVERARKRLLPEKLGSVAPLFRKHRLEPQDIKILSHPIDYVAFDGIVSRDRIRRIVFLDGKPSHESQRRIQRSIDRVVSRRAYDWVTLRVDGEGSISVER